MNFTPAQCRAARALLDWSQQDLATASAVATKTLADFEKGKRVPYDRTLAAVVAAFESAGVQFIDQNGAGPGVRLRDRQP